MHSGSFVFASVHYGAPIGSMVDMGSRRLTRACLGVMGYIRVHVGSLGGEGGGGGLGVIGVIWVCVGSLGRS